MSNDQFVIELLRDPGHKLIDFDPIAEALVLLHSESVIDEALSLAHKLNATRLVKRSRRRAMEAVADDLRYKLAQVEEQIQHGA